MAVREQREVYSHATIDCSDMTLTEYDVNGISPRADGHSAGTKIIF